MPDAEGIEPTAAAIIYRPAERMVMEEWQPGDVVIDNRGNLYARASERDADRGWPWGYVSGATRTVDGLAGRGLSSASADAARTRGEAGPMNTPDPAEISLARCSRNDGRVSGWTIDDAAELLHPEMTTDEIRAMIELFGIPPYGSRRTGRRGRPLTTYDPTTLQRAHAVVMRARVDLGVFRAA